MPSAIRKGLRGMVVEECNCFCDKELEVEGLGKLREDRVQHLWFVGRDFEKLAFACENDLDK